MAWGKALTGIFRADPQKRIELVAQRLREGTFSDAEFDAAVHELRQAGIPDDEILKGLYEQLPIPRMVVKYGLVDRLVYFPSLDATHFLKQWQFGTAPLWLGFLELAEGDIARTIDLARGSIADDAFFSALLAAESQPAVIFEAYFSAEPPHSPALADLVNLLHWDDQTIWPLIQAKYPAVKESAAFLCARLPDRASAMMTANWSIDLLVGELLEKTDDHGALFVKAILTMNYPLAKTWSYLLARHQYDKIAAIRFVFLHAEDLLKPMLVAVMKEPGTSVTKPVLADIVTVFEEVAPNRGAEEEECLAAESVVSKLGWNDLDIFEGCLNYCRGNIGEMCMLMSRHFPALLQGLVLKRFGLAKIIAQLGKKYFDHPQRCDRFLKRNGVSPARALEAVLQSGNAHALVDFSARFPTTCARALAERLPDDPATAVSVLASRPWPRRTIFLALAFKLDCEGAYDKVFNFAQENFTFLNMEDLALGMFDDGHPVDEIMLALFQGTTGHLPDLLPIAHQMRINQRELFRLFSQIGEETKTGEANVLLGDLIARQPEFSVGQLLSEIAAREPMEIRVEPFKLIEQIVRKCPGVLKRSNGFAEMHDAYVAYYRTCFERLGYAIQEAVGTATQRDSKIGKSLKELSKIAASSPRPEADQTLNLAAERANLGTGLFVRLIEGEILQDLKTIATADPSTFGRPERTVLRMLSMNHAQLNRLYEISQNVEAYYPLDAVATLFRIPAHNTAYISIRRKLPNQG